MYEKVCPRCRRVCFSLEQFETHECFEMDAKIDTEIALATAPPEQDEIEMLKARIRGLEQELDKPLEQELGKQADRPEQAAGPHIHSEAYGVTKEQCPACIADQPQAATVGNVQLSTTERGSFDSVNTRPQAVSAGTLPLREVLQALTYYLRIEPPLTHDGEMLVGTAIAYGQGSLVPLLTKEQIDTIVPAVEAALASHDQKVGDQLAKWMIVNSFATGHGDTVEDLLKELKWQIEELRTRPAPAASKPEASKE